MVRARLIQKSKGDGLELQKQDTVMFYILRDYRIVAHQDQAA